MRWLVVLLLSGCASSLEVTYVSNPAGATFWEGGKMVGVSPVKLSYPTQVKECVTLNPVTAVWISGARYESQATVCPQNGLRPTFTMSRGQGPGMEVDANYALRLQQTQLMERQTVNQEWNSGWQMGKDIFPKSTNCTTFDLGGVLQTRCN